MSSAPTSVDVSLSERRPGARTMAPSDLPAWPVLVLLWGYPLFWALGLLAFAQVLVAIPMLAFLIMRWRVTLVPGVLPWLGFALWMLPASLMIDQFGRLVGLGVRFSQFLALAIMMIYIVNARSALSVRRVLHGLTFIWLFVIVGGYLGMLFPDVRLNLTIGRLLPDVLTANDYVRDLVFPPLAEIQTPWGVTEPFNRPSAPFAYTNGWGAAIAVLTPIALATALGHDTVRSKILISVGIIASIPPAVATTNRGLIVGIAAAIVYVVARLTLRGAWLALVRLLALTACCIVLLQAFGLMEQVNLRQESVDTAAGRSALYVEAWQRTLQSPLLGYGAPRPSTWSEISVGTQGAIWNAMFCFGFVGLLLFIVMLVGSAVRTFDAPNASTLWLHASVVVTCLLSIFYGLDRQLVFIGIAVAVMLREKYLGGSDYWSAEPARLGRPRHAV